jgi:hypothetical protein
MPSARDLAACTTCAAAIVWTVTEAGRRMAVNAAADDQGNQAVHKDVQGILRSRALNGTGAVELRPHEWRAMPHAATCTRPRPPAPRQAPRPVRRPGAWRYR